MPHDEAPTRSDGNRGRWLVIALVALAVVLGIIGLSASRWVRPRAEPEVPAQDAPADVPAVTDPQPAP